MYCFQQSLPLSRPPPVFFSPPNAPPISAPLVPVFTLAIPQSLPTALRNFSASRTSFVKIEEVNPWGALWWCPERFHVATAGKFRAFESVAAVKNFAPLVFQPLDRMLDKIDSILVD